MKLRNKNEECLKRIKNYVCVEEHPLIVKLLSFIQSPKTLDENSKCDEVFAFYLYKVAKYTRQDFFIKVLKFVILFRECLNITYKKEILCKLGVPEDEIKTEENGTEGCSSLEYSEVFNPEDAPDISNEFVTDYLGTDNSLMEIQKEEAIDFTQNLCQWLYDNNYTCSKLSLINNC